MAIRRITERSHRVVREVTELLASRYRERLRIREIALAIGTSPHHLCRVFRAVTGTTVHRELVRRRVEAATSHASLSTDLTMVALDVGFGSHAHFTSTFKRVYGVTPSEFRRLRREDPRASIRAQAPHELPRAGSRSRNVRISFDKDGE